MAHTTVLIVDDEGLIRWSLSEALKAEGHHVLEADTGAAALEKLLEGVDLVLLDYKLPDTDGVSVLRKIKQYDADVPVIMLTAYVTSEAVDEAMEIGAYRVLDKPFDLDRLTAIANGAIQAARFQRQNLRSRTARRLTIAFQPAPSSSTP